MLTCIKEGFRRDAEKYITRRWTPEQGFPGTILVRRNAG